MVKYLPITCSSGANMYALRCLDKRLRMTLKLDLPHLHPTVTSQVLARARAHNPATNLTEIFTMSSESRERGGGTRGRGRGHGRREDDPNTKISKALSYILRHGAEKEGLKLRGDGYANVAELVSSLANSR